MPVDVAERAGLDRIDQRAHALAPRSREIDILGRAAAALGDMGRRAALARVDDLAGEQSASRAAAKPICSARSSERVDELWIEMRLRPVEIDARRRRSSAG